MPRARSNHNSPSNVLNFNSYSNSWGRSANNSSPPDSDTHDVLLTTHSSLNTYIPFYAGFINNILHNEDTKKSCMLYELYSIKAQRAEYVNTIRYKDLLYSLMNKSVFENHLKSFRTHSENVMYQVTKGCILHSRYRGRHRGHSNEVLVRPLIALCFAKEKYTSIGKAIAKGKSPDPRDFVLIMSNDINEVEHKALYAQLRKHYINPLKVLGVDILYTDNIYKYCFKGLETESFSSFTEKQTYLSDFNKKILDEN